LLKEDVLNYTEWNSVAKPIHTPVWWHIILTLTHYLSCWLKYYTNA